MYNYIRMELYRLFHSKSPWVILVIMILFNCFSLLLLKAELKDIRKNMPEDREGLAVEMMMETAEDPDTETIGIVSSLGQTDTGKIEVTNVMNSVLSSKLMLLFCSIFTALFICAEEKSGFMKNISGQMKKRGYIVAGNVAAAMVYVFILFVCCIPIILFAKIIFGDALVLGSVTEIFKMTGVQYVLHTAFCLFLMLLCLLTRSTAFGMIVGLVMSTGMFTPLHSFINKYIVGSGSTFDIGKYVIENNVMLIVPGAETRIIVRALVVGVVFAAVALTLSVLLLRKRDVR